MADMNQESIQQKIQIARRDAEALKDRIKRKKDELADTTRTSTRTARPEKKPMLTPCAQSAMSRETVSRLCRASP
jgi:guanine nucleotide-binding protein G(I)/G(S)/G(T) subunit beta-1